MEKIPTNIDEKVRIVLEKNTYFYHLPEADKFSEGEVSLELQLLIKLRDIVKKEGITEASLKRFIINHNGGLKAILTLIGISAELFKRIISFIRIDNDAELVKITNREKWAMELFNREWDEKFIENLFLHNEAFSDFLLSLFLDGMTIRRLKEVLPYFEFKKFDIRKLRFEEDELLDTIIRYNLKGHIYATKISNPEVLLENVLQENNINYERGRLNNITRTMDFIIPDKERPKIIIESYYAVTTSSTMGDKAKAEIGVKRQIDRYYDYAVFIGFVDGIAWFTRPGDLKQLVSAFDNVFTFHPLEIERFLAFATDILGK
jgi:hypothetical protein